MNPEPLGSPPHGHIEIADRANRDRLSRLVSQGRALRLTRGLYAVGASLSPEQVAQHHLYNIIAKTWPGAVLIGRSALAGGLGIDGHIYIAHPKPARQSRLTLPGVSVHPYRGPGRLPHDMQMPEGLWLSGQARQLVENVSLQGRQSSFRAGTRAVDDRIDELARSGGAGRIKDTLDQLDVIARYFDPRAVAVVRRHLASVIGTLHAAGPPVQGRLSARLAGTPYDEHRIDMIRRLAQTMLLRPPTPRAERPPPAKWRWLPFFEAYFSNFIEGTEFGVDEARRIAVEGVVPAARPEDAHDISATYQLAADPSDRTKVPASGAELIEILRDRHATLMAARPDKHPGVLKSVDNFAGGYQFVDPALVTGTLIKGFDALAELRDPLSRAAGLMALITECHPFDDGNGRVARLTANAELSAAGEVRIIIPTVYRDNYLAALNGFSNGAGNGEQLAAVLEFGQRWTAAVEWSTFEDSHETLQGSNAYLDSRVAERSGVRLTMPATN